MSKYDFSRLYALGINRYDSAAIRRIAMTLHRWYELECGDSNDYASWAIERDEETDKPYMVTIPHAGKTRRTPIPDREKGAIRRLDAIMKSYPDLAYYLQTDPRGASVYIYRKGDQIVARALDGISSVYSSVGVAVYK